MDPKGARASDVVALEGENLDTTRWENARHWIGIYTDLLNFKRGLIERVRRDTAKLPPIGQKAVAQDLGIIEGQMDRYEERLRLWNRRLWDLHGLLLDADARAVRYQGEAVEITHREFQLLEYLIDNPHRYMTTAQIVREAWSNSRLSPEEVRNYIRRLRTVLRNLGAPADIINRPSRGYSPVNR
jgi:DNA-binding response OmpR family regulator